MRISSQLLLNFLLHAAWQIALIAALASLGAWLLRSSSARYRHWLWVTALCLAFLIPATTAIRSVIQATVTTPLTTNTPFPGGEPVQLRSLDESTSTARDLLPSVIQLNSDLALILIGFYGVFILYRSFRLFQAWQTTRNIRRNALDLDADDNIAGIVNTCESAVATGSRPIRVLRSETLPVPVTMGLSQPVIILPDALLREGNPELLTSAIGHEFVHVARKDYLLNFIYELLYVPLSFHPAAALLRRRIKQTRELCCDELVADRIVNAEVYARSLLRLAGSAPTLRRLSVTTTVGIADADILEARIMSLLRKPKMTTRWKKTLLVAVSLLLLVPCVAAAAAFNMRFDLETVAPQEPAKPDQVQKEKELDKHKRDMELRDKTPADVLKERISKDPQFAAELERRRETELEMRDIMHTALIRLARVSMEQAIQIATSHKPGKVLTASLGAKGWEEPGKLGKDGVVFYHVLVADEANGEATDIWVNAIDGTLLGLDKQLPRSRQRSPEKP